VSIRYQVICDACRAPLAFSDESAAGARKATRESGGRTSMPQSGGNDLCPACAAILKEYEH
jgi:hypothetical protein